MAIQRKRVFSLFFVWLTYVDSPTTEESNKLENQDHPVQQIPPLESISTQKKALKERKTAFSTLRSFAMKTEQYQKKPILNNKNDIEPQEHSFLFPHQGRSYDEILMLLSTDPSELQTKRVLNDNLPTILQENEEFNDSSSSFPPKPTRCRQQSSLFQPTVINQIEQNKIENYGVVYDGQKCISISLFFIT